MPLGQVSLWLLPRRKVLAWRVAQKVDAGDTGFRLGRGLGQGHRPRPACAWWGLQWAFVTCSLDLYELSSHVPEGGTCPMPPAAVVQDWWQTPAAPCPQLRLP